MKGYQFLIGVGILGMSLHHFQFYMFSPDIVGEAFGVLAYLGFLASFHPKLSEL